MNGNRHRPVMLAEVIDALGVDTAGCYMDLTFGRGGHAVAILERLGPGGRLVVVDKDPEAIAYARSRLGDDGRVSIRQGSFVMLHEIAVDGGVAGAVQGILLDLGVSSPQLDDPRRGFSFRRPGPLDMRMDPGQGMSAAQWLAAASEREIADVLYEFGEERHARRIARAIVAERREEPIEDTTRLAQIVTRANASWEKGKDPATRTFQAIRIFINSELEELRTCLAQILDILAIGGRLVVISFHSLEDRIVKRFIRQQTRGDDLPVGLPVTTSEQRPRLRAIGRARRPGPEEILANPRARSAVMRVAEKIH